MTSFTLKCALAFSLSVVLLQAHAQDASASQAEQTIAPVPTVQITDHKIGSGVEAVAGTQVQVHYAGWLYKENAKNQHGKQFDSSRGGKPLSFTLGTGRVIKGWEQGIAGMKVGGKRTLVIPSELAYGKKGAGAGIIPPDATLVFDVELVAAKPAEVIAPASN